MNFSQSAPESNYTAKPIYIGKDEFNILAVNPSNKELKDLGLFVADEEPQYARKVEVAGKQVKQATIRLVLKSVNTGNIENLSYTLTDTEKESSTGKFRVINQYGQESWLEDSAISSKTAPSNMSWYLMDGVKKSIQGEAELVNVIRALRRMKNVGGTATKEEKEASTSLFTRDNLDKILKGDFSELKSLIMSTPENKVGWLLGVKTTDDGKYRQDFYRQLPLQSWQVRSDNSEYLFKRVKESQENGGYANTYFDLTDGKLTQFDSVKVNIQLPTPTDLESLGDFSPEAEDDLPF